MPIRQGLYLDVFFIFRDAALRQRRQLLSTIAAKTRIIDPRGQLCLCHHPSLAVHFHYFFRLFFFPVRSQKRNYQSTAITRREQFNIINRYSCCEREANWWIRAQGDKVGLDEVPLNYTSPNTLCRQVYFWGGGKAGSSTLFFTLTRGPGGQNNPANTGPFLQKFPKEPCQGSEWRQWESLTKDTNICGSDSDSFTHIINGCPRETSVRYAQKVMNLCDNPKFLMLVRDPVDRLVSLLNDQVRRGGSKMNIEEAAKRPSGFGLMLAKQGEALKNLLSVVKDPTQILIIPMESISVNGQGVIDAIMDFVDGRRWKRNETDGLIINNGKGGKYNYVSLSPNTTEILRNKFREDVLLLESLVGKRFSWSSWARHEDTNSTGEEKESKSDAWLVTSPL